MQTWNILLTEQAASIGPLLSVCSLVAGVIILLLGWRLSRLVAVLDFAMCGAVVGASLTAGTDLQWLSTGMGAVAFGALALWMDRYSELVACGLLAGLAAAILTGWLAPPMAAVLLMTAVAFGCSMALTCIAHRQASAVMTSVQGGVLSAFGAAACLSCNSDVWGGFRDVLVNYSFAPVMFVVAPIMVGVMFQLASIQNEQVRAS